MRKKALYPTLLLCASLLLVACHGKDDPTKPGGSTPVAAMQSSVELLKKNAFNDLWKHSLPPADYATLQADWSRHMRDRGPITPADRLRFNQAMQQLTAPDAKKKLDAELLPKLDALKQKYGDQLPVLLSVGDALVKKGIAQSKTLTAEQQSQADAVMDVITPWAQKAPWFDREKAKQSIGVVVDTARKLDLKNPDQLQTMDFHTAMDKYATGFVGVRQLLNVYGLSVKDTLDSVKLSQTSMDGDHAVVKIDYTLLGKPLSMQSKMVKVDGRWYSEGMIKNVRASHQKLESTPASVSASATPSHLTDPVSASTVAVPKKTP